MTAIKQEDLIQSIADAFQYISYYHPLDYIKALGEAYEREESPAAKDAIAQILTNSRMAAEGHRPICQDTGIGMVFIKVGMNVTWPDATMSIQKMIDEGVRRAYANPDNPLRASVLADPAGARKNTKDNTPAVVHKAGAVVVTGRVHGHQACPCQQQHDKQQGQVKPPKQGQYALQERGFFKNGGHPPIIGLTAAPGSQPAWRKAITAWLRKVRSKPGALSSTTMPPGTAWSA